MKAHLLVCSSLVACAGTAGAVDVTLGGTIDMGWEYGVGKSANSNNGFAINAAKEYQNLSINLAAAGTTDSGLKFGGSFSMSTDDELAVNLLGTAGAKKLVKLKNTSADQAIKAAAYNVSGGQQVLGGSIVSVKINSEWHEAKSSVTGLAVGVGATLAADSAICKIGGKAAVAANDVNKVTRENAAGTKIASVTGLGLVASGYMAAGRLANAGAGADAADPDAVQLTANTIAGALPIHIGAPAHSAGEVAPVAGAALDADLFTVALGNGTGAVAANPVPNAIAAFDDTDDVVVANAAVYAGPFVEVAMTSSTTKMVIGAVCVTADVKA